MGLGNALRRFRGRQPQSDSPSAPNVRRKPSRSRDAARFHEHGTERYSRRRSPHPITYSQSAGERHPQKSSSREHQNERQRADQERVVIESYRTRALEIAEDIMIFLPQFDADAQSLNMHHKLYEMKTQLKKALESYRAALGRNTGANIDDILNVLVQIDKKLAAKPHQIPKVPSFTTRGQGSHHNPPLHNLNTADNIHRASHAKSGSPGQTRSRDTHPSNRPRIPSVRKSSPSPDSTNDGSSSSGETYATAIQHPTVPTETFTNSGRIVSGYQYTNGYRTASFRENSNESCLEPASSSQSFATYEEFLKASMGDHSYQQNPMVEPKSAVMRPQGPRGLSHQSQAHYHQKLGTASEAFSGTDYKWSHGHRSPIPVPDDNKDDGNSESGDEGPLHLVSSRTSNSLHQKAESARSQSDDRHPSDFLATDVSKSPTEGGGQILDQTGRPYRRLRENLNLRPSNRDGISADQPMLTTTHNMSFASTLYQTRNARVGSINDTGIFLRRSNVRGDGRCLFRALVRCRAIAKGLAIPGERAEREEADILRECAVEELIKHEELLDRFFVIEGDFIQYLTKMSHPRTYGGEPELLMLAKVLHVPIAVYILKGQAYRQIQVYGKQYRGEPLRILYSDGVHYDSLIVAMRTSRQG